MVPADEMEDGEYDEFSDFDPEYEPDDEWDEHDDTHPRGTYVKVDGWSGIAFFVRAVTLDRARVVMVGDDRVHEVDRQDLTLLKREDFCGECGQIGCGHDGLDRTDA